MMHRTSGWTLLVLAGAIACQSATGSTDPAQSPLVVDAVPAPYEAIDLGLLPGVPGAQATDINESGQVVGWGEDGANVVRAFIWEDGVLRDLGSLGGGWSVAYHINDAGQVVGLSRTADGRYHNFLWSNDQMYDLEPDAAVTDRFMTPPAHINNAGHVAFTGIVDWNLRTWHRHAYLWRDGVTTDLGTLGGSLISSQVTGINELDQVVGVSTGFSFSGGHAFIWDGGIRDLGTFGGSGSSSAADINDRGQVVGSSNGRAVLWADGQMTDLGSLPGDTLAAAVAINEAGQVTGNSQSDRFTPGHAFRWQAGVILPLSLTYPTDSVHFVRAANEQGVAAGGWGARTGGWSRAVAWEGGMTWMLPAVESSHAAAMNERGDVVGYVSSFPHGATSRRAVLWRRTMPGAVTLSSP